MLICQWTCLPTEIFAPEEEKSSSKFVQCKIFQLYGMFSRLWMQISSLNVTICR